MVVVEEYYDKDDTRSDIIKATYEVSKDTVGSEQEALDHLWNNEIVAGKGDWGTIQKIAGESRDQGAYYEVEVVFSTPIHGNISNFCDVSDKEAVAAEPVGTLQKALSKLGL